MNTEKWIAMIKQDCRKLSKSEYREALIDLIEQLDIEVFDAVPDEE